MAGDMVLCLEVKLFPLTSHNGRTDGQIIIYDIYVVLTGEDYTLSKFVCLRGAVTEYIMKYLLAVNSGLKKGRLWGVHALSLVSRPILPGGLGTRLLYIAVANIVGNFLVRFLFW